MSNHINMMEVCIVHGLIRDKKFFDWLKINHEKICSQDNETLIEMDYHNCRIKGEVVEEDPTEQGIRSLLVILRISIVIFCLLLITNK